MIHFSIFFYLILHFFKYVIFTNFTIESRFPALITIGFGIFHHKA